MLNPLLVKRVILAQWRVDFRMGHNGLLGECRLAGFEPWAGDCVVFISRCRTRIKMLFADPTGLWVDYKQFAKGAIATEIQILERPKSKELSFSDLSMLLDGNRYTVTRRKQTWKPLHLPTCST
jgi:IS66 Orf2 like protein